MRFRSLTVTRTLTFLTIVAIAGVVLLPIIGNCQIINHGWTSNSGNTAKSFKAIKPDTGDSWIINASVNAKGVSASVSPSSHNVSLFEVNKKYTGNGYVTAARHEYIWFHDSFNEHLCDNREKEGGFFSRYVCQGHTEDGDIDTNRQTSPFYNDNDTALVLDIQVSTVETHTCLVRLKQSRRVVTGELDIGDAIVPGPGVPVKVKVGGSDERVEATSLAQSVKATVKVAVLAQDEGVYASVGFDDEAASSAHAHFSFESISDSGSVWYDPP